MELQIIKYFTFMIWSVITVGIMILWLKSNRLKRQRDEQKQDSLEIEKYKLTQIMNNKKNIKNTK